ncbi:MAG: pilus assembly protein PilM [Verrucomicrobia bacterium]|nr:pilus assembly protein PilM [Verrucomicrobiota bacterium]
MSLPRVLAVDCGAGHVACGLFSSDKSGRIQLEKLTFEAINPDASLDAEWNSVVSQTLSDAIKREQLSGECSLGLPGHHILGKFIKIPAVEASKLDKIVQFEAQQNIPYALNEVVWDYQVISEQGLDLELMLAAAKKEVVQGACDALSDNRLTVSSVLPSSIAVTRCFRYNYPEITGGVIIADVGARSTNLIFIDAERFFVRTIPLAGNSITQAIAEELKHDFAHCETIKIQVLNGQSELPTASPARAAVQNAVNTFIGKLHLELTRSIVNHRRQSGAEQPVALYLTGGSATIEELSHKLGEKLKLPVERLDALKNIGCTIPDVAKQTSLLAGLVGLALPATKGQKSVNLIPPAIAERLTFKKRQPLLIGAAVLVALSLLPLAVQSSRAVTAANQKLKSINEAITPLQNLQSEIKNKLVSLEEVKTEILSIQSLAESKNNWINFLSDLQARLVKVEDVWLESLQVIRPSASETAPASGGGLLGNTPTTSDDTATAAKPVLRLQLTGRLIDRKNPVSRVSPDSYERIKTLLASFVDSQFISAVERESFDATTPGILKFDFILVIDPARPL